MKYRVNVEVSRQAFLKLAAEVRRREGSEGRGTKYPMWRIIDELLQTLPDLNEAAMAAVSQEQKC